MGSLFVSFVWAVGFIDFIGCTYRTRSLRAVVLRSTASVYYMALMSSGIRISWVVDFVNCMDFTDHLLCGLLAKLTRI